MADPLGAVRHLWASPWTGWVGLRYLRSKKHSQFLSMITLISVLGVGLGVTAMIVVLSVMDGFETELHKRLMSTDLHILISPRPEAEGFSQGFVPTNSNEASTLIGKLAEHPKIQGSWPIVSTEVILRSGKKVTGVVLKGVTAPRLEKLRSQVTETAQPQMMVEHEGPETIRYQGVFVGQELAYDLGVIPGDFVTMISPTETEGPMSSVPRLKRFVVEGIYRSGLPEQELHTVFASESSVRSFLRRSGALSSIEISVKNFEDAPEIAREIQAWAPRYRVQDWIQLNAHLFYSLKLERLAMFIILTFIVIVASFNIVTTLTLMVLEKKREISILKAMGARDGQVAAIFLSEGILIGALGVGGGVTLGFFICSLLRRHEFIKLPEIYYDRTLPVTFDPVFYSLVAFCALLIVLGACLYPSRRAARLNPLDGIRFG